MQASKNQPMILEVMCRKAETMFDRDAIFVAHFTNRFHQSKLSHVLNKQKVIKVSLMQWRYYSINNAEINELTILSRYQFKDGTIITAHIVLNSASFSKII